MYLMQTPKGDEVPVPRDSTEDGQSFLPSDVLHIQESYRRQGFTLIRGVIAVEACTGVRQSYETEVKPYRGALPRINGADEINRFNVQGFIENSLMNVQRKPHREISGYVQKVLSVLTDDRLKGILAPFFPNGAGLMTWNHIEANPVTKPHCDAHFWTKDIAVGDIVGVWVALEDIYPGAGRLYVYPHSHEVDMRPFLAAAGLAGSNGQGINVLAPAYQAAMLELVKRHGWVCTAPSLKAGDVLLWDSRTIHGSLETSTPEHSRSSFTAHFSASHGPFISTRARWTSVNGVAVTFPKSQLLGAIWDRFK